MNLSDLKKELLKSTNFRKAYLKHDINYEVARMLIEARILKGFTQEKLASSIGTTQSSIARAEQGRHAVSFDFLEKIAKAYKTYIIPPRFAFMDSIKAVEARNQLLTAKPPSATAYFSVMKREWPETDNATNRKDGDMTELSTESLIQSRIPPELREVVRVIVGMERCRALMECREMVEEIKCHAVGDVCENHISFNATLDDVLGKLKKL